MNYALLNEGQPAVTDILGGIFEHQVQRLAGDVNEDGTISSYDASLVLQHTVYMLSLNSMQQKIADVSGNEEVRAFDGALILRRAAGIITTFPVGDNIVYPKRAGRSLTPKGRILLVRNQKFQEKIIYELRLEGAEHVIAGQWKIGYNPEQLVFAGIQGTEWTQEYMMEAKAEEGIIHIAMAGPTSLEGNGALLYLQFEGEGLPEGEVRVIHAILNEEEMDVESAIPDVFALSPNYPNPFNPLTTIKYQLPEDVHVRISIYNILGQKVRSLVNGDMQAGYYSVEWDSRDGRGIHVASGIYFYRIEAGTFVQTRKMLLIK